MKVRMEGMNGDRLVKQVYNEEVIGRRPRGRDHGSNGGIILSRNP